IVECYGDLADHIFAVETGLSSDPAMNWRLSMLDRYRLTSNSDAHSPGKLGREATTFDCDLDYFAIRRALETGAGYAGTVEFFPEEGKYHLDGHRKCGSRMTPEASLANGNRCPVCGEAVTIGVLHRVNALADRSEMQAEAAAPATAGEVRSLVPLPEILSEIAASGVQSKIVERGYDRLLTKLGAELAILQSVPVEDIARAESSVLAEAISRLRAGKVIRESGYDGEYGIIRLFEAGELKGLAGGVLFEAPIMKRPTSEATKKMAPAAAPRVAPAKAAEITGDLDEDQRAIVEIVDGPLLIVAGPGSGKTRTLTERIAHIVERGVLPENCLAVTFTRRAAAEMRERLARRLPAADRVPVHTFHSLGLSILREHSDAAGLQRGFRIAGEAERAAMLAEVLKVPARRAETLLAAISKAKRTQLATIGEVTEALVAYRDALAARNWIDFDDLVGRAVKLLADNPALAAAYRDRFRYISVDEFQDIDDQQYRLLALLAPAGANVCVIGDPDQAIYGFRGADAACFGRFKQDRPKAALVGLRKNYRSRGTIIAASSQIITASRHQPAAPAIHDMHDRITIHAAPSERAEAEFVVATIEHLLGGHNLFSIDSGRADGAESNLSFADIAVLCRTGAQLSVLGEAFARSGLPFNQHSHEPIAAQPAVAALLRALAKGSGKKLTDQIDAAPVADPGLEAAAIETARQYLRELAEAHGQDRAKFFDAVALATESDFWDERAERVSLLTLHAAKGLEFAVVFIVGLEDGILPLHWHELDAATAAEERRLFYVGMTRAKDRLFLSRAHQRNWHGRVQKLPPSPFLRDIEEELTKHQRSERKRGGKQLKLL
ncbi:MAG TPA: UvrD-helicase domain-containing protein, partial [Xanthobacteraceae bacterium]|nr:UvrD-helicase domain-containing protein [Xanthobacteraceae bacterium]